MADVESLELKIVGSAKDAEQGLDSLITTLDRLGKATAGGCGLNAIANPLRKIGEAANTLNGTEGQKISSLAKGLQALAAVGNVKLSSSIGNQLSSIGAAIKANAGADYSKIGELATAVQPLTTLGKSQLGPVLNQLKKLPEAVAGLNSVDISAFSAKIRELTAALQPLANEMQKVSNGFAAFPERIQKFISASNGVNASNKASGASFAKLATKIASIAYAMKRAVNMIASWVTESNEYVENMNLFTVSMGEYAGEAMDYANAVSEAMGIDPSDWIRNQGASQSKNAFSPMTIMDCGIVTDVISLHFLNASFSMYVTGLSSYVAGITTSVASPSYPITL